MSKQWGHCFLYHPARNFCAVFDSNGRFEKLWQFSSYLVQKSFKIVEVGETDKFLDGDFPKAPESDKLILRACGRKTPERKGNTIAIHGKVYEALG